MKQLFLEILCVLSIFTISNIVAAKNISCPPTNLIQTMNFDKATLFSMDPQGWIWFVTTNPFSHENLQWILLLGGPLSINENKPDAAIKKAEELKKSLPLLDKPIFWNDEDEIECIYYRGDGIEIAALSPPPRDMFPGRSNLRLSR